MTVDKESLCFGPLVEQKNQSEDVTLGLGSCNEDFSQSFLTFY